MKIPITLRKKGQRNGLIIRNEFSSPVIDFTGLDEYRRFAWQRQLHLYEVPFYYIEYGIAQLGAIGLWQQYKRTRNRQLIII